MDNIRIIIAEDHALMREGTRHILEQYPGLEVVGEAADGQQALEIMERTKPDVAILDIRMPELNGIEVVRRMKNCCPDTKALILTAYDDDDYIFALVEAGASGYLLKTASAKELADSVRTVYSGASVLDPAIVIKIGRLWAQGIAPKTGSAEQFSPRELEILDLAARGLRNKAIADKLGISSRTVESHFNSIFIKLGVFSRMEAVIEAISRNLVNLNDEEK